MHIPHRPVLLLTNRLTLTWCICLSAVTLIDSGVAHTGKYFTFYALFFSTFIYRKVGKYLFVLYPHPLV